VYIGLQQLFTVLGQKFNIFRNESKAEVLFSLDGFLEIFDKKFLFLQLGGWSCLMRMDRMFGHVAQMSSFFSAAHFPPTVSL
jgi:hypothetical protein